MSAHFVVRCIVRSLYYLYKGCISPFLGGTCRFYPSCSEYCLQCIEMYGVRKGLALGVKRLIKCRPGGASGIDFPGTHTM